MNQKNKKYLILFVGVIILFIIFVGIILLQQSVSPSSSSQNQNTASVQRTTHGSGRFPLVTLAPPASSPKAAAQQFYTYYFSSPANPLANGAYKSNPYLSPDFKQIIGRLYNNGNVPVFCPENESENITVDKEQTVYYNKSYLTQEVISQAPPGNKDLYRMLLENVNGKWLIFDINCI